MSLNPRENPKARSSISTSKGCLRHQSINEPELGFTLTELLAVLGGLVLLAALAVPVLANGKSDSQRSLCASNMSRISRALAMWGTERGDLYPWLVQAQDGGIRQHPSGLNNNSWFNFSWVSNELMTPKILACPSDPLARVAQHFGGGSNGFLHNAFQNNAVSYTLSHPHPEHGRLVLSSDRSMIPDGGMGLGCSQFGSGPVATFGPAPNSGTWSTDMHPGGGNLLFNDGSVEMVDVDGLRKAIDRYDSIPESPTRPSRPHFLFPRPPIR